MARRSTPTVVMAGLVPAIHAVVQSLAFDCLISPHVQVDLKFCEAGLTLRGVDGRDKPGHDGDGAAHVADVSTRSSLSP